jgi:hypothetical protein
MLSFPVSVGEAPSHSHIHRSVRHRVPWATVAGAAAAAAQAPGQERACALYRPAAPAGVVAGLAAVWLWATCPVH